jgi:hypothetical protein
MSYFLLSDGLLSAGGGIKSWTGIITPQDTVGKCRRFQAGLTMIMMALT